MPRRRWNSGVSISSTSRGLISTSPCTASRISFLLLILCIWNIVFSYLRQRGIVAPLQPFEPGLGYSERNQEHGIFVCNQRPDCSCRRICRAPEECRKETDEAGHPSRPVNTFLKESPLPGPAPGIIFDGC